MKKLIILFISSLCLSFTGCNNSQKLTKPKGDCFILLLDITDSLKASVEVNGNYIFRLLQVATSNPLASANVCFVPITNIRFERRYCISIPETDKYSSNELDRNTEIDTFKSRVTSQLNTVKTMPRGLDGSAIFESIAIQLDNLAECNTCSIKQLVVISDLLQKIEWFNAYDSNQLKKFVINPANFKKEMEMNCPVKNSIKGIKVYLIHQPRTVLEDNRFYKISNLLKAYLIQKGAIVQISSTLQ